MRLNATTSTYLKVAIKQVWAYLTTITYLKVAIEPLRERVLVDVWIVFDNNIGFPLANWKVENCAVGVDSHTLAGGRVQFHSRFLTLQSIDTMT